MTKPRRNVMIEAPRWTERLSLGGIANILMLVAIVLFVVGGHRHAHRNRVRDEGNAPVEAGRQIDKGGPSPRRTRRHKGMSP